MKKYLIASALPLVFLALPLAASAQSSNCTGPSDTSCGAGYACQQDPSDGFYNCFLSGTGSGVSNGSGVPSGVSNGSGSAGVPSGTSNSGSGVPSGVSNSTSGGLQNPLGFSDIPGFLNAVLGLMISVGSIVIVIMIVYVGFLFVTAQGAEEKIKDARQALLYTVIGALILLGAQAISSGIQATVAALGSGSTTTTQTSNPFGS